MSVLYYILLSIPGLFHQNLAYKMPFEKCSLEMNNCGYISGIYTNLPCMGVSYYK